MVSMGRSEAGLRSGFGRLWRYALAVIILIFAVGILLYIAEYVTGVLPVRFATVVDVAVAAIVGYFSIVLINRQLREVASKLFGARTANTASVAFRYGAYIILVVILLGLSGVSGTALLAGGAFAGLILGLAGQTVLSNVFAGVLLLLARPFEVGDKVTVVSSQYGLNFPSYQPKYFSEEYLIPGYSGTVKDLGFAYTTLLLEDGKLMKIPNSVMIQAGVVKRDSETRRVRVRYQLPPSIDPEVAISAVTQAIKQNEWVLTPESVNVYVEAAGKDGFLLLMEATCKGARSDPPRSSLLITVNRTIERLKPT
jgi:small conductance mechanosensitive channel